MEEEKDFMSIFGDMDNIELNVDSASLEDINDLLEEDKDESQEDIDKDITEQDNAEDVGDEEDDENSEEDDADSKSSPNLYSSIANALYEKGIIPSLESSENIKNSEDLLEVFKKQIDIQAQKQLEEYLDNLDVSKIADSKREQMTLESITPELLKENLDLAKQIIYKDYLNQGLSEERATKLLKKTIDLGEEIVLEDAEESLKSLKTFETKRIEAEKLNSQKRIKEQQEIQAKLDLELKNKIYNSEELVKGVKTTKALQDRTYQSMTEIVGKNPETGVLENKLMQDRSKDPIGFDTRMYFIYELTNGFTDFSKVAKDTKSKAINELEEAIRKTKIEDNGIPTFLQDGESYGGIGTELVL